MAKISTDSATESVTDEADAQQELKRRARRRLVGASALALAAIIVLPMVMDHEPRVPSQDIQVRIPSQDGGGISGAITSRVLAEKGPTPLPPAIDIKPAKPVEPKPAAEPVADPKPAAKADPAPEPKVAPKAEVKPKAETAAKVAVPAALPAKPEESKPAEARKTSDKDAARASAALSGSATEQWVVQLGAYKDAGNVKLLVKKLKEMGVPSYTEAFDTPAGARTRVRAGPFATKEAAEKAQAKAKIVGVSGPVAPK